MVTDILDEIRRVFVIYLRNISFRHNSRKEKINKMIYEIARYYEESTESKKIFKNIRRNIIRNIYILCKNIRTCF